MYICNNCNYVCSNLTEFEILNQTIDECANCNELSVGIIPIDNEYRDNILVKTKRMLIPSL